MIPGASRGETILKRPKILIIDDEYLTLAMLEDILSLHGYKTVTANNADSGLMEALHEHPDLIILDIILPDRDGFSLLSDLKKNKRTKDIPVILLSALSESHSIKTDQVAAFIHKPVVQQELLSELKRLIGSASD